MDIVERLRFDATRCQLQFSRGVAGNIEEAAAEIERLRKERDDALLRVSELSEQCIELIENRGLRVIKP